MNNYAVILAGGRGIRFWPLSRQEEPKQLLKLFGNYSLLQHTYLRISKIVPASNVYVVTNRDYAETIRYQLKELGFFHFQRSVFLIPYPCADEIGKAAQFLDIEPYVHLLTVMRFPKDTELLKKFNLVPQKP